LTITSIKQVYPVSNTIHEHPRLADFEYRFCPKCGGRLGLEQVKPHEPKRLVCAGCRYIFFLDPKVAACTIFELGGKIVLARRAIDPGYGKWVFPGGFVDRGETVEEAAVREAKEEVNAEVELRNLVGVYSYSGVPVVVVVFSAVLVSDDLEAADECLEIRYFTMEEIPWEELAFSSTHDALKDYLANRFFLTRSRTAAEEEIESG
jgi:ADP-ribose pyrophosphatase YjhB (NUDIX family)